MRKPTMRMATLCAAAALFSSGVASAGAIYKCADAAGAISYQSTPCAEGSAQSDVTIRQENAPPAQPSDAGSNYRLPAAPQNKPQPAAPPQNAAPAPKPAVSYRCSATNGDVFYRHDACPDFISDGAESVTTPSGRQFERPTRVP